MKILLLIVVLAWLPLPFLPLVQNLVSSETLITAASTIAVMTTVFWTIHTRDINSIGNRLDKFEEYLRDLQADVWRSKRRG